jgi:hypothetical protein
MRSGLLGQMVTPNSGNRLEPDVWWALDNGCFSDNWSESKWLTTAERYASERGCVFAVVPDVVGDAAATDALWERYAEQVRHIGYRAAYVTQNGCQSIPSDADAVFTGGDDAWKLGPEAHTLIQKAKALGLWTHMGRVNSLRRLRVAVRDGYDSCDGTYLAFGPDTNLPRLLRYLTDATTQHVMFGGAA